MKTTLYFGLLLCLHSFVNGDIAEKYKQDLFNILTGIAIDTKNATGTPVTPENITYYLFTEDNPKEYIKLDPKNPSQINKENEKYVFLLHGWTQDRETQWYEDMKDAFLKRDGEKFNVIQVDWSDPADQIYAVSSINTKDVGQIVGDFVVKLNKENDIPLENIHLVGHSLGGQVAGFVGKKVYNETGHRLPRITALDPAGPLFASRPDNERLNSSDAKVVSVIHTDGGKFGFEDATGTIDFFPNGGSDQAGCAKIDITDLSSITEPIWCDHHRSYEYFIEAVLNPGTFVSKKCTKKTKYLIIKTTDCDDDDTVTLGDLNTNKTGKYYLETNSEKPFSKNSGKSDTIKVLPSN